MDKWNIIFRRGATYGQTITVTGVDDIANATVWRIRCAVADAAPFLEATIANGMISGGNSSNQKIVTIPAATTATFPTGNARFDFELEWANGKVQRLVGNGDCEVLPETGEI